MRALYLFVPMFTTTATTNNKPNLYWFIRLTRMPGHSSTHGIFSDHRESGPGSHLKDSACSQYSLHWAVRSHTERPLLASPTPLPAAV